MDEYATKEVRAHLCDWPLTNAVVRMAIGVLYRGRVIGGLNQIPREA